MHIQCASIFLCDQQPKLTNPFLRNFLQPVKILFSWPHKTPGLRPDHCTSDHKNCSEVSMEHEPNQNPFLDDM